jgi:superfamily I DNA/RNA helicase
MALVRSEDWRPRGIVDLEPAAWTALRHDRSSCVVAGPGAGKTEFLAQRAVYLLETGLCPSPFRLLAISFKSDAAANLAARVRLRCPPELAARFTSLTFDGFTKSLVDRFLTALPAECRRHAHTTSSFRHASSSKAS